MKPTDFFIGINDFFAILVPGVVLTWLVILYLPPAIACGADLGWFASSCGPKYPVDISVRGIAFFVIAYILGNFVFMVGSQLDPVYDRWRKRTKPLSNDLAYLGAKQLAERVSIELKGSSFSTLKWSMSYVQIRCPSARVEIERLEASQKLFRGLVVICACYAAHFFLHRAVWSTTAAIAIGILSFSRFCDQRWKMTELAYATAVMLSSPQIGAAPAPPASKDS